MPDLLTPDLLTLMQWLSPSFPTGAFAYSHGLEQAIADGLVSNDASFQTWLTGVLRHGAGWQDAVLLNLALQEGADHAALADLARALAPSAERLLETMAQGEALARTISAMTGREIIAAALPVALGQAAQALALPCQEIIAMATHAFASNLVSVATRAVPLGQTSGQRILATLHPLIEEIARKAAHSGEESLANAALAGDLLALRHESLDVRIYRT